MQRFSELDGWPVLVVSVGGQGGGNTPSDAPKSYPPRPTTYVPPLQLAGRRKRPKTSFLSTKQKFFGRLRRPIQTISFLPLAPPPLPPQKGGTENWLTPLPTANPTPTYALAVREKKELPRERRGDEKYLQCRYFFSPS